MSYRVIKNLQLATQMTGRPQAIPIGRPRGAKALGVRYEKLVAKQLPSAKHGIWWSFRDGNGPGYCQTDLLMQIGNAMVVLEVKYTWLPEAHGQLSQLYVPVVEKATGLRTVGVVVCKRLVVGMPDNNPIVGDLMSALDLALAGQRPIWHYSGVGSLWAEALTEVQGIELR